MQIILQFSEREYLHGSKRRKVSVNEGKNQIFLMEHKDTKDKEFLTLTLTITMI